MRLKWQNYLAKFARWLKIIRRGEPVVEGRASMAC